MKKEFNIDNLPIKFFEEFKEIILKHPELNVEESLKLAKGWYDLRDWVNIPFHLNK